MAEYGVINVSVSNHYSKPTSVSDVVTQGLLGEKVEIIDTQETHIQIRQQDDYLSWIPEDQLVVGMEPGGDTHLLRSHFVPIFSSPDLDSPRTRDAVIGSQLQIVNNQGDWCQIILPDGICGWVEGNHFADPLQFSSESITSLAQEFLGYQYFWGGRTPKGFDCSGFVQTVFGLHGVRLPRDAWQQQQYHQVSTNFLDARPGDLLFFSRQSSKVIHVAISLGEQKYIHASGWVRLDSFNEEDQDFTRQRSAEFVSVNRYS
ncbi:MAG: NlpC/P60 family protein [Desulfuromusa sp.]